ncbi:MAG: hypothetical protein FJ011_16495 [Chloroflexi bacterium]|nr:hypothetical protein [Chloroflexota bacterium]
MFGSSPPPPPEREYTPYVVFQPAAGQGLQRGINQMVNAIRPTLGPRSRFVAIGKMDRNRSPELVDNGGVIVRRTLALPDRDADMGAMFVRQMVWRQHERHGDGTATLAVLFQSIFNQGVTYLASGGNAMLLRNYLEKGLRLILAELAAMATSIEGEQALARLAESICYDPALARLLGEIFDIIGEYGRLEVRDGSGRELEREYVEGIYWDAPIVSRQMMEIIQKKGPAPGSQPGERPLVRAELENPAILISDLEIQEPRDLVPALSMAIKNQVRNLVIVARSISDNAIAVLLANRNPEKLVAIGVKTPGTLLDDMADAMRDLAALTGGQPLWSAAGDTLARLTPEHLGRARRAWADLSYFGIVGGGGDPRVLRDHIAALRASFRQTEDADARKKLRERIGKLMGGAAMLFIGAATETEMAVRKELAVRTADAVRGAMLEGVMPGGGVALLDCRPALQRLLKQATDLDERAAYRILIRGLEEPARTLIANAGADPSEIMAEIKHAGPGHGFDAAAERVIKMTEADIWDAASTLRGAVTTAVMSAGLALTTSVLVHHRKPTQEFNP